jgi:hypothetical protein
MYTHHGEARAGLCSAAALSSILFGVGGRLGTSTGRLSSPFTRRPPAGSHPALRKPVRGGRVQMANSTTSGAAFAQHAAVFAGPGVRRRTARRGRCLTQPTLRPAAITGIAAAWRNHQQAVVVRNPRTLHTWHLRPARPRPGRRTGPPGQGGGPGPTRLLATPGGPVTAVGRDGISALCSVPWRKGVG